MSSEFAIQVQNLSKCYQIYNSPRDRLKQFVLPRLRKTLRLTPRCYYREFSALKNFSLQVKKGETVGIVGRNGSGKSTLLQMICGTLSPSSGSIATSGRIAALLELGSGFNPEFTGRENVYLNGAVLGLAKEEIDQRFDAIVTFSEIGEFIDQPVKTYSSGMMVRLAFSVAINADPQILIVDEALSVGDELFQRKCFSRIESIRRAGATILFVSHAGGTIVELCDQAVLLDAGEFLAMGAPKRIIGQYQKLLYAPAEKRDELRNEIRNDAENPSFDASDYNCESDHVNLLPNRGRVPHSELSDCFDPSLKPTSTIAYASYGAFIQSPMVYTVEGARVNNLTRGRTYIYRYNVVFKHAASNVKFGMLIKTLTGVELGGAVSASSNRTSLSYVKAGSEYKVEFEFRCSLNPGVYFLNAGVVGEINGNETYLHRMIDVDMFRVNTELEDVNTGTVDFSCVSRVMR